MKFYKANTIKSFPKGVKNLRKLKEIIIGDGVKIPFPKKFKLIYKWLPNVKVFPLKEDWYY